MICVILGAGFSHVCGVPLASQLFNDHPEVDRLTRQKLVERVVSHWTSWQAKTGGVPEQYLAFLQERGSQEWRDALWFVSLIVALKMGRVEIVGGKSTITKHNVNRTTQNPAHEDFWSIITNYTFNIAVITTNYDILPERGLRHQPRPRLPRPGFHYGDGPEPLEGGGYPSYSHIRKIVVAGTVPLYKLHGSVSWSFRAGQLIRYYDCRPAIRGDAAIVAPMTTKVIPHYLQSTWQQAATSLSSSDMWIVVGYSLPAYDVAVRTLLCENGKHNPGIHIFDPNPEVAQAFSQLLPKAYISSHPGLPNGLSDLEMVLESAKGS